MRIATDAIFSLPSVWLAVQAICASREFATQQIDFVLTTRHNSGVGSECEHHLHPSHSKLVPASEMLPNFGGSVVEIQTDHLNYFLPPSLDIISKLSFPPGPDR